MATEKMLPCCARHHARLSWEKGELKRLARLAARRDLSPALRRKIADAKERIREVEQGIIDHEADHAAEEAQR